MSTQTSFLCDITSSGCEMGRPNSLYTLYWQGLKHPVVAPILSLPFRANLNRISSNFFKSYKNTFFGVNEHDMKMEEYVGSWYLGGIAHRYSAAGVGIPCVPAANLATDPSLNICIDRK